MLADSGNVGVAQYPTRQVHNIAIDPLDENYFISAGTAGDPTVTVWDQRFVKQRNAGDPNMSSSPVLEYRPIVDNSHSTTIWSLRFCGTKKSTFGVLANTGEFKIVEIAQHAHKLEPHQSPPNQPHGTPDRWTDSHYTKVSHTLRHPWYDERHRQEENSRVVACDFMTAGSPLEGQCALALFPNREVEVIRVPPPAPRIHITALDEIYRNRELVAKPSARQGTVGEDLLELQSMTLNEKPQQSPVKDSLSGRLDKLAIDAPQRNIPFSTDTRSSQKMHEELLTLNYPNVTLDLSDYLRALQTQKRRCQEGYNLDCRKNKEIVANDPWLMDTWSLIERMDNMAEHDGMVGAGLDLKYLGVASIWSNKLSSYENRLLDLDTKPSESLFIAAVKEVCASKEFPPFTGIHTAYPSHRQLCLALCGWNLSKKGLREKCHTLLDQGQYYKAIVLAVFKGYKDIALDLLRETIQQNHIQNISLGAVIACDSVNEDQRHMCAWMADMTDDPYLKALLAYFISGDWKTVVDMPQLSLTDRVALALKYLDDDRLTEFLLLTTAGAIAYGNISGLILTGLTDRALDLLDHHISKFGDLQSAVLILSRACPLYLQDSRFPLWRDIYLSQMQVWQTYLQRTHYIKSHNRLSVTREGKALNKPAAPSIAIRCAICQQNLALRRDQKTGSQYLAAQNSASIASPAHHSTHKSSGRPHHPNPSSHTRFTTAPPLTCPTCSTQMPRCALCMLWLGSPDPAKQGAAQTLEEEDLEARLMVFCMNCTHGFHGHHARDWFGRHRMCPVPDCGCVCGVLR